MTNFIIAILMVFLLFLAGAGIADYVDKRMQERRKEQQIERSKVRQAMNCDNCTELWCCRRALEEVNQERQRLESALDMKYKEIEILQSSLTKARLHNQTASKEQSE